MGPRLRGAWLTRVFLAAIGVHVVRRAVQDGIVCVLGPVDRHEGWGFRTLDLGYVQCCPARKLVTFDKCACR